MEHAATHCRRDSTLWRNGATGLLFQAASTVGFFRDAERRESTAAKLSTTE